MKITAKRAKELYESNKITTQQILDDYYFLISMEAEHGKCSITIRSPSIVSKFRTDPNWMHALEVLKQDGYLIEWIPIYSNEEILNIKW